MPYQNPTTSSILGAVAIAVLLTGCDEIRIGSDPDPEPDPGPSDPAPQSLVVTDSVPRNGVTDVDPTHVELAFAHLGFADLDVTYSGDCPSGVQIRRAVVGLSHQDFDELLDHRLRCTALAESQVHSTVVSGQRPDGTSFETELTIATGAAGNTTINVLDSVSLPLQTVNSLFESYFNDALLPELNLPGAVEDIVRPLVADLADNSWVSLSQPDARFGSISQRVSYLSRDPDGNVSAALTGLVAFPDTTAGLTQDNHIIVLSHATGSTPGDLDPNDAWYLLANVLAAQGYLVIAADNWGRGGTDLGQSETYLMANRTAANSLDLVRGVLADTNYDAYYRQGIAPVEVTIIGYSQGGHSAMALWQTLVTQGPDDLLVRDVFAGGAPYNLYETVNGVLEHLDDRCDGGDYCRLVNSETTVPFATDRILPGFVEYPQSGLTMQDVTDGDSLAADFVSGFLDSDPAYDSLKLILQQSTFSNVTSAVDSYASSTASMRLYHSDYDRLVPEANTQDLLTVLAASQTLEYREATCNDSTFETIFQITDFVGINHVLCGISMMDDVTAELNAG